MQAEAIPYIKLMAHPANPGCGFELFPYWQTAGRNRKPYTTYLFAVTGGEEEILAKGKRIVEEAGAKGTSATNAQEEAEE